MTAANTLTKLMIVVIAITAKITVCISVSFQYLIQVRDAAESLISDFFFLVLRLSGRQVRSYLGGSAVPGDPVAGSCFPL